MGWQRWPCHPPPSPQSLSSGLPTSTFSPGSHPSCFSAPVSLVSALLIPFTHPWSHIWTALSLKLSVAKTICRMLNQHKHHHAITFALSLKPASRCERGPDSWSCLVTAIVKAISAPTACVCFIWQAPFMARGRNVVVKLEGIKYLSARLI